MTTAKTAPNHLTPDQLADALESGKYKRHKGSLSAGPRNQKNCCLGVAVREVHDGKIDPSVSTNWVGDQSSKWSYAGPDKEWYERHAPWISADGVIEAVLMGSNDSSYRNVWQDFTIPFLRELKVNKDGRLSKRQTARTQRVLDDYSTWPSWADGGTS